MLFVLRVRFLKDIDRAPVVTSAVSLSMTFHVRDFNAIEGWWHRIRQRLEKFSPEAMESRSEFVQRLRRTVTWLNENSSADAVSLCTNQKVRARQVKSLEGARCKW